MNANPIVSIIVPTYNYGHLICETLDSVLRQTYPYWECIVVDDGSTDLTKSVIAPYVTQDTRIKYSYQTNKGLSAARNKGINFAIGNYIQLLDSDDLIETDKFARQVEYLQNYPDIGIVYGNARYFDSNQTNERCYSMREFDKPWMPQVSGEGTEVLRVLIQDNIMPVNAPLVRRDVLRTVGEFDESLSTLADWDYWIRCGVAGVRFKHVDFINSRALVRYHADSMTHNKERLWLERRNLREKINQLIEDVNLIKENRTLHGLSEGYLAMQELQAGKIIKGVLGLVKSATISKDATWIAIKWVVGKL